MLENNLEKEDDRPRQIAEKRGSYQQSIKNLEKDIENIPERDYDRISYFVRFWEENTPDDHWLKEKKILSRLKNSQLYRTEG